MAGLTRIPLPQALVDQARAFESGVQTPAEPRNAATVVLLRDGVSTSLDPRGALDERGRGPEAYLLLRHKSMAFAAEMAVFPGGGVDSRDFAEEIHDAGWAGPTPSEWATTLGCDVELARALVCAAVRETFEESGVLLAGTSDDSVVEDTTGDDWEADRVALESRELSMTDFLVRRGLVLRSDLLGAWSGWLTPIFEPRRYRTWFFVAQLPTGQATRDVSSESSSVSWTPTADAVDLVESGGLAMLPPTYLTCLEVAQYPDVAAVLTAAHKRSVDMFTPQVISSGEEFVLSTPDSYAVLLEQR